MSVPNVSLFIAYLVSRSFAPATIASYVSAMGYVHRINGYDDPTGAFIIKKLMQSCQKTQPSGDHRLPITKLLLHQLIHALNYTTNSYFDRCLYSSMFTLAFHAFLRIGEMTGAGGENSHHLMFNQVTVKHDELEICFLTYKHSNGVPFRLIVRQQTDRSICAVYHLKRYLSLRGGAPGPLFAYPPATPLRRYKFNQQLRNATIFCDMDPNKFKSHSFRIGACTEYVAAGASDSQIRQLGRWKSDAFKKYIRIASQVSHV